MAYQEVNFPVQFSGGVETKADPKGVPPTRLLELENGVFTRATTITKRNGYVALSDTVDGEPGTVLDSKQALAARGDELLLFANGDAFSRRTSEESWSRIGACASLVERSTPIARTGTDQSQPDLATLDGVTLAAWEDSRGGVWHSLIEQATGRVLVAPTQTLATGSRPRCVAAATRLHLYLVDASAGRLHSMVFNPANLDTPPTLNLLSDELIVTAANFDASSTTIANAPVLLGYNSTPGAVLCYVSDAGAISSAVASPVTLGAGAGPVAVSHDAVFTCVNLLTCSGSEWTAYQCDAADLSTLATHDYNTGATIQRATIVTPGTVIDGQDADAQTVLVAWEHAGSTTRDNLVTFTWLALNTTTDNNGPNTILRGHTLITRGFVVESEAYVSVAHDVDFFPYAAALRLRIPATAEDATQAVAYAQVSRTLPGTHDGAHARAHLSSVQVVSEAATFAALYREQVNATSAARFTETSIRRVTLDYNHSDQYQAVQYGPDLIVGGALPLRYDGDALAELGFNTAPDGVTTPVASAGGALSASASYLYVANYEEIDAAGELHPGPVSVPLSVSTGAGQGTVTLTLPTYRLTNKRFVRLCVWRSDANDTSGDPIYYKVTALDQTQVTGNNRYLANDPTVDTLTFVDTMSDAILRTQERLYTTGGILSNDPAPVGSILAQGKGRLFFNDPADDSLVRYSQEKREGVGCEISSDLALRIDDTGGPITGLAVLDDAVVVFKRNAIYFFAGQGPLANPDASPQAGFSPPVQISSDVGCTRSDSIGLTPAGLIFQSDRGIYLLSRARAVVYLGAPVEAYNAQAVRACTLMPGRTQILCLAESGKSLLFDYYHGQWSTFTNHTGLDAVVAGDAYYYLRTDGRVFKETHDAYLDGTTPYSLKLTTAWIKLAQYMQAMQKVWWITLLGTYYSPHDLRVRIQTDYERGFGAPIALNVTDNYDGAEYGDGVYGAGLYGAAGDTVYQRRVHVGAKCQAFRVCIEDVSTTDEAGAPFTLGKSFDLAEMLVTGGVMRGQYKLGSTRSD